MFLFFKGFKLEIVFILFVFYMKHSYLLTAKITSDIKIGMFYQRMWTFRKWMVNWGYRKL